jgi:hypothetical protein
MPPRNSQNMLYNHRGGASYLPNAVSVTNTAVFPIAYTEDEATKFTEVRGLLCESMARVIRRDQNTNGILALIAEGRTILKELKNSMSY